MMTFFLYGKGWEAKSGAKEYYIERNARSRKEHREGRSIQMLSEEYELFHDTIRRILYK